VADGASAIAQGDALYSATIKLGQPRPSDPSAASRLHELLGYVEQVIKLDEKAVFRLAEHRLANGQIYQYHQNEFHALPGVKHDATDNDGPIWLTMERLKRHHPPKLTESLEIWLEISPDPERTPVVRESVLDTVSASVRDSLVAEQKVRPEDCQPAFGPDGKGKFDIRYRIEDHPEITAEADAYLAGPWLAWANEERPRRRSIALYQRLFEVAQLAELGGPEQPIELVWGIGLSRWTHEGTLVDLPLLERLVEIEIDERAAGLLRIRPRQADAAINLRPYEELKLEGLPLAQNAARRALALSAEEEGVSPYLRETFEPILRACQSHIDAEGRYLPDGETLDPTAQVPAATAQLTVSDRWVIFARKRNDNFLLKDIENLQKSIEQEKENLPGPALTLVTGPERATSGAWKPLTDVIGGAAATFEAEEPESPLGDLFFPKPFNSEQIEIVRRLEKTDGVVVQGPPGTGKTHTISNIICHYLATGRRVLVVSHGEAALSVLREKLPEQVRDLAISITTSEREGLKQLEGAIRLLQSVVQTLRPGEQKRVIRDIESSIVAMRARIAAIDVEMERAARLQLSEVAGRGVRPAQLAKSVVTGRSSCAWLDDRPQAFLSETQITLADIDALRRARIALGPRLEYFDAELPSVSDLPSGAALAQLHADILGAQEHAARANANPAFVPRVATLEAVSAADSGASALDALLDAMRHFDGFPWLRSFAVLGSTSEHATHIPALQAFMGDAAAILDEYKRYVQSPVNLPDGVEDGSAFAGIINKLAEGQNAFGLFAFGAKKLKPLIDEVRVVGRKPRDAQEWSHVKAFLNWRIRFSELSARWDAVSASLSLNDRPAFSIRYLVALVEAVQTILVTVPKTRLSWAACSKRWRRQRAKSGLMQLL
jgi:hypothetical protein